MRPASNRVRRARPSLGTFVEITARGDSESKLHAAIDRAFAVVARVDRQMSFHHAASDISGINCEAFQRKVTVDPWTWRVLRAAQKLERVADLATNIAERVIYVATGWIRKQTRSTALVG